MDNGSICVKCDVKILRGQLGLIGAYLKPVDQKGMQYLCKNCYAKFKDWTKVKA